MSFWTALCGVVLLSHAALGGKCCRYSCRSHSPRANGLQGAVAALQSGQPGGGGGGTQGCQLRDDLTSLAHSARGLKPGSPATLIC